jgi:hypothetical protein
MRPSGFAVFLTGILLPGARPGTTIRPGEGACSLIGANERSFVQAQVRCPFTSPSRAVFRGVLPGPGVDAVLKALSRIGRSVRRRSPRNRRSRSTRTTRPGGSRRSARHYAGEDLRGSGVAGLVGLAITRIVSCDAAISPGTGKLAMRIAVRSGTRAVVSRFARRTRSPESYASEERTWLPSRESAASKSTDASVWVGCSLRSTTRTSFSALRYRNSF